MKTKRERVVFFSVVIGVILIYWTVDSIWSVISYDENLKVLLVGKPSSWDTFFLAIPPHQIVSRLLATLIFVISSIVFYILLSRIRERERRFYNLFYRSSDAIILLKKDRVIDCNRSALELFKYDSKTDLLINNDIYKSEKNSEKINEAFKLGNSRFRSVCRDSRGKDFLTEITLSKSFVGEELIQATIRSIEDTRYLSKSLRDSENKYKTLVETIPFGIQEINMDGMIVRTNRALHSIFDSFKEDLVGRYIWDIPNTKAERIALKKYFYNQIKRKKIPQVWKGVSLTSSGRKINVEVHWDYIRDSETSEIKGMACVIIDVTKKIRSQIYQTTFNEILSVLNKNTNIKEIIRESLEILRTRFKISATAVRLINDFQFPFYENTKLSEIHLMNGDCTSITNSTRDINCLCSNVICDNRISYKGNYTDYGSYWTNDFVNVLEENESFFHFNCSCRDAGYNSLCIIPLKSKNRIFGTLQLFDDDKNIFDNDYIHFFETIADSLSISLSRQFTQIELEHSESVLKSIFNAAPIGMGIIQYPERVFIKVNHFFTDMVGYAEEELIGKNTEFMFPNKEEYRFADNRSFNNNMGSVETKLVCKNGESIVVLLNSAKVTDTDNIIFTALDITEKKNQQQAIIDSENVFRTAFETIPDAVAINRQQDGAFIHLNEGYVSLSGYTRSELIGRAANNLWRNVKDREFLIDKIREEGKISNFEIQFVRKDGEVRDGLMSAASIVLQGSSCTLTITRDITDRKRREKDLIVKERQLRKVAKMEAVGTLAGGVAHDFNNVIQIISGNVQLLMIDADEYLKKKLGVMYNATLRGADLSRRLLTFSRNVESKLQPIDVNSEIRLAQKLLDRTVSGPVLIDIKLNLDKNLNLAMADPTQLNQIITNLTINAKDAMSNGGEIIITTKNIILDTLYCQQYQDAIPGEYVQMSVSDNGEGMSREVQERIFEPFFTTKIPGKGTGLGLAVVYGIVQSHHGHLTVYSAPGKGTEFKVYLPIATDPINIKDLSNEIIPVNGGTETVLIIDDEEEIRSISRNILERYGYKVLTAKNGEEGIKLYKDKNDSIDLIILDLVMPFKGGAEVLKEVKDINPSAKVLIASGYSTTATIMQVVKDGANMIVNKPYTLRDLLSKVRETIDFKGDRK